MNTWKFLSCISPIVPAQPSLAIHGVVLALVPDLGMVWPDKVWYGMVEPGKVWCNMVQCGQIWYGILKRGKVWYSIGCSVL